MEFKNFSGKINTHDEYLKLLDVLEKKCQYIEIVLVFSPILETYSNKLVEEFKEDIIEEKMVSRWWGTKSSEDCKLYKIKASKELFSKLRQYETFCKYYESPNGDHSETTDFGQDDIAFFDDKEEPLLFTTTHEGYINIREDLII